MKNKNNKQCKIKKIALIAAYLFSLSMLLHHSKTSGTWALECGHIKLGIKFKIVHSGKN